MSKLYKMSLITETLEFFCDPSIVIVEFYGGNRDIFCLHSRLSHVNIIYASFRWPIAAIVIRNIFVLMHTL
jgi:hypothetical protein